MNGKLFLGLWAIVALVSLPCLAGDDPGAPDSVRIRCPYKPYCDPDSMSLEVYLLNDEPLFAFSLGFVLSSDQFRFSSWRVHSDSLGAIDCTNCYFKLGENPQTVLVGWVDTTLERPLPITPGAGARLLATIYIRCNAGTPAVYFHVDSTFVPPGGRFILVDESALGFTPKFQDCVMVWMPTDDFSANPIPPNLSLKQNSPNPFNSSTAIKFDVPLPANVQLDIVNVLGENVTTLIKTAMPQGRHEVVWDGKDRLGNDQPSGVYFYRLTVGNQVQTRKMVLLK